MYLFTISEEFGMIQAGTHANCDQTLHEPQLNPDFLTLDKQTVAAASCATALTVLWLYHRR